MSEQGPENTRRPGGPEYPTHQERPPLPADGQRPPTPPRGGPAPGWHAPPAPYNWSPVAQPTPPLPPFPHPEPREYHQMLRTWNYAWWKPLVGAVVVILGMFVLPFLLMPILLAGAALEPGSFLDNLGKAVNLEDVGPMTLLWLNLSLGASILVCWLVMRLVHRMRLRWLTSVVPKMRWKLLFIFVGISVIALVAQIVVSVLVSGPGSADASDLSGQVNEFTTTTALLAVVVLLTTPLQAAGEEYVFRGYLMQSVGSFWSFSWVRPWVAKWLAIAIPAVMFAIGHGAQNFPLFFDRFMFGLIAGWLVIRTGGLEAGIAMHILNNFLALGYALVFSDLGSALQPSDVGWENIPVTLTQAGTYALLVTLVARKMKVQRRTAPPAGLPPQGGPSTLQPVSYQP